MIYRVVVVVGLSMVGEGRRDETAVDDWPGAPRGRIGDTANEDGIEYRIKYQVELSIYHST